MAALGTTDSILQRFIDAIITPAIYLLFVLALFVFMWGVFQMMYHADDPESRRQGKQNILWGVIGFVIMVGVYGLIRIITGTFGIENPYPY
ncbi:MAG: pilin [Patescibacteria group bacterium]